VDPAYHFGAIDSEHSYVHQYNVWGLFSHYLNDFLGIGCFSYYLNLLAGFQHSRNTFSNQGMSISY
jgi:hypothetical protein